MGVVNGDFMELLFGDTDLLFVDGFGWDAAMSRHLEFVIVGALIMMFLIVEPHGLARLWSIVKEKLRLWPFPH
jgi:branched-chain amino acid transport system permease protein